MAKSFDDLQGNDIIDVRDLIERAEELKGGMEAFGDEASDDPEYVEIMDILAKLKGNGGDEQWDDDWYPATLIKDSYFTEYAQELLEDTGTLPKDLPWYVVIDWEQTAKHVRDDYGAVDVGDETYWYR